jgi:hypothetical protein
MPKIGRYVRLSQQPPPAIEESGRTFVGPAPITRKYRWAANIKQALLARLHG